MKKVLILGGLAVLALGAFAAPVSAHERDCYVDGRYYSRSSGYGGLYGGGLYSGGLYGGSRYGTRDWEHDRKHRQLERAHERAHDRGFYSRRDHKRWHEKAGKDHDVFHHRRYGEHAPNRQRYYGDNRDYYRW